MAPKRPRSPSSTGTPNSSKWQRTAMETRITSSAEPGYPAPKIPLGHSASGGIAAAEVPPLNHSDTAPKVPAAHVYHPEDGLTLSSPGLVPNTTTNVDNEIVALSNADEQSLVSATNIYGPEYGRTFSVPVNLPSSAIPDNGAESSAHNGQLSSDNDRCDTSSTIVEEETDDDTTVRDDDEEDHNGDNDEDYDGEDEENLNDDNEEDYNDDDKDEVEQEDEDDNNDDNTPSNTYYNHRPDAGDRPSFATTEEEIRWALRQRGTLYLRGGGAVISNARGKRMVY